ncbi:unnamed protein product [Calicophoron daubneyi]|uniref:Microtubule-associated protein 1A/B/S-like MBL-like domain-containing protein n=1 Tax=Calicophoron daubneyi TaxID=300641 RepID=A0AAV2T121_CALDB
MAVTRVLAVLGEVLGEDQKNSFVKDLNDSLSTCPREVVQSLAALVKDLPGESESRSSEDGLVISRSNDRLEFVVASRPSVVGLNSAIANLLKAPDNPDVTVHAVLVYAGLFSEASAHWLLPNYVFSPTSLTDLIEQLIASGPKPVDAENQPAWKPIRLHIGCAWASGGEWKSLVGHRFGPLNGRSVYITANRCHSAGKPKPSAAGDTSGSPISEALDLTEFLSSLIQEIPAPYCDSLAQPLHARDWNDPTLKVGRPCLYVFPEGSGQASILALPGYNILINAGCSHRPNFWPVANYLDRLDAVILTHWGIDNLLGVSAVLPVAFAPAPPEVGVQDPVLCLLTAPPNPTGPTKLPNPNPAISPLCLSIPRQITDLMTRLKQAGTNIIAQPLSRNAKTITAPKMVQLYQKVGQGSLELHTLTPGDDDSAEVRKLTEDWAKGSPGVMATSVPLTKAPPANKFTVPLLSHTSVSALIIWRPAKDTEAILRILVVASNTHQTRVLVALETLVSAQLCLRHAKAVPSELERKRVTNAAPRRSAFPTTQHKPAPAGNSTMKPPVAQAAPKKEPAGHAAPTKNGVKERPSVHKVPVQTKKREINSAKITAPAELALTTPDQTKQIPDSTASAEGSLGAQPTPSSPDHSVPLNGFHNETPVDDAENVLSGSEPNQENNLKHLAHPADEQPATPDLLSDDFGKMTANGNVAADHEYIKLGQPNQEPDMLIDLANPEGLPPPPHPAGTKRTGADARASQFGRSPRQGSTAETNPTYPPGYTEASAHASGTGGTKLPPYDKVKPVYVDVAFIPGGGNPHLVDAEWFKRVRARFYVATDPKPSVALMEALTVGKESWTGDDAQLSASLILAHDSEEIMTWIYRNSGRLADCHLDVAAVASRSSIQLMSEQASANGNSSAQPVSCPGYRIDF